MYIQYTLFSLKFRKSKLLKKKSKSTDKRKLEFMNLDF